MYLLLLLLFFLGGGDGGGGGGGFTEQKDRDKHFWGNLLLMNVYKTFC